MWLSVSLLTDASHAEGLSEALLEKGAISVDIEDADAGTTREKPQFGEPGNESAPLWDSSRVVALFPADTPLEQLLPDCATAAGLDAVPPFSVREIAEQNWVQLTQSQFEPIRINERLWIVPSWHAAPDPSAINLVLDPGMAFGTGSHPTTRLCLEWLCATLHGNENVLDYGCGSGILAIAALRLGAAEAIGIDIDEQALAAARDNATRNQVQVRLIHSSQPLDMQFDCVIANILTNPLCMLAPLLAARVRSGGCIALSGILATQAKQVIAAYRPFLPLRVHATLDGWVLLEGERS